MDKILEHEITCPCCKSDDLQLDEHSISSHGVRSVFSYDCMECESFITLEVHIVENEINVKVYGEEAEKT